jgi:phosphomethylpyrimidine synthase
MTSKVTRRAIRGLTKLVKIREDVRKFAAEQKVSEEEALRIALEQKATEFAKSGSEIYAKT